MRTKRRICKRLHCMIASATRRLLPVILVCEVIDLNDPCAAGTQALIAHPIRPHQAPAQQL